MQVKGHPSTSHAYGIPMSFQINIAKKHCLISS